MESRQLAAIYLAQPEQSAELSGLLGQQDIECVVPKNSDEFYELLSTRQVDIVVVENELRSFLRGIEILERVYDDLLRPATVLVANETPDLERRAQKIGIQRIVPGSTSTEQLARVVRLTLLSSGESRTLIPAVARRLVQQAGGLRPLPQLLVKLGEYLTDPTATAAQLAKDISVDPRVTADLMRLTNSSVWGRAHKATCLQEAVNFLGIRRTVSLVLSSGVLHAQSRLMSDLPHHLRVWYHSRGVLMGSTAAAFAERIYDVSPETAYVLGLMQDTGILLMANAYGARYHEMLKRCRDIAHIKLEALEQQEFQVTHAEVSAAVLQRWELPQSLINMVLIHHSGEDYVPESGLERAFLHAIQIGNAFANLVDHWAPQRHHALNRLLARCGPDKADACKACLAEAVSRTRDSSQLFSIPAPNETTLNRILERFHETAPDLEEEPHSGAPDPSATAEPQFVGLQPALHEPVERPRILIIDSDRQRAALAERYLQDEAVVLFASDLRSALHYTSLVQAVICDVQLERMHGADLVWSLRVDGFAGPILMTSSEATRATVERCIRAGINDFMLKPYSPNKLREKLKNLRVLQTESARHLRGAAV